MSEKLFRLTDTDLRTLAAALRSGRLSSPITGIALRRLIPAEAAEEATREIEALVSQGMTLPQIAAVFDVVLRDRAHRTVPEGLVDLVTTGPDAGFGANRDTAVVVRELFANATESVLVAGYAVYQGQRVFQALADRMQQLPSLRVRMFLDIQRSPGDTAATAEIVRRFAERFLRSQWPQDRPVPELYYDPRALDDSTDERACLHAKCVVVDGQKVFVSSANFTEAAQLRNIEVGVLVDSKATANQITEFFDGLVGQRLLLPIA